MCKLTSYICVKYGPTIAWSPFQNDSIDGDHQRTNARQNTQCRPVGVSDKCNQIQMLNHMSKNV